MEFKWAKSPDKVVEDAFKIREEVFVNEQGFKEEFDDKDNEALHIVGYENGEEICCARIFYYGDDVWYAGRIAVKKKFRGTGSGATLMEEIVKKVRKLGGKKVILGAQCRASGFYLKQGFEMYGEEYLEEGCPHIKMARSVLTFE